MLKFAKPKPNDIIIDIGSNDCTLLNFYKKEFTLVGFEPAQNIRFIDKGKNIKIFSNYFNANDFKKNFDQKAKVVTSCAMFYDLKNPKKFLKDILNILDDNGIWCVQISYLPSMLKNNNFYDICHEHISYYSLSSFEYLLKQLNLKCIYAETNAVNGGSIRLFVCKNACNKYNKPEYFSDLDRLRKEEEDYKA